MAARRKSIRKEFLTSKEVVQSYITTSAVYDFNVYEKRIIYKLVEITQSQLVGLDLRNCMCKIEHKLQDVVKVTLPYSELLLSPDDRNHHRIREALESLHHKTFQYRDDKEWGCLSIIANPKIIHGSETVSFIVDTKVWDVLLDFSLGFTKYDIHAAFRLESPYSMRLFEMISSQSGPITFTIEKLRLLFKIEEGEYKFNKDFISRVIEGSRKELDGKAPVSFQYVLNRTGRKITSITFHPVRSIEESDEDRLLISGVKRFGIGTALSKEEIQCLYDIGFEQEGIERNISVLYACHKHMDDFLYVLSLMKGQCRTKDNPRGWCIETLKGKLSDMGIKVSASFHNK